MSHPVSFRCSKVRYDGNGKKLQLMVNGRVCCEAVASSELWLKQSGFGV